MEVKIFMFVIKGSVASGSSNYQSLVYKLAICLPLYESEQIFCFFFGKSSSIYITLRMCTERYQLGDGNISFPLKWQLSVGKPSSHQNKDLTLKHLDDILFNGLSYMVFVSNLLRFS